MSNMKHYIYLIVLIVLFSVSGCVKDDSPYPNVAGTSWTSNDGGIFQRLSFADNTVTHIEIADNDTTMVFNGKYNCGSSFGKHFYMWDKEENSLRYKVYSYGYNHIVLIIEPITGVLAPGVEWYPPLSPIYFTKE